MPELSRFLGISIKRYYRDHAPPHFHAMMTFLHVVQMRVVGPHSLWLRFSDGAQGTAELGDALTGDVLGALNDPALFAKAAIDEDAYTVCWPNGADLAPEFLRERLVTNSNGRVAERPSP